MTRIQEDFHKLKFTGSVDVNGHTLESPDLWEKYIEAR